MLEGRVLKLKNFFNDFHFLALAGDNLNMSLSDQYQWV